MKKILGSILFMIVVFAGFGNYDVYGQSNSVNVTAGYNRLLDTNSAVVGSDFVYGNDFAKVVNEFSFTPTLFKVSVPGASFRLNSFQNASKVRGYVPVNIAGGNVKVFAEGGLDVNRFGTKLKVNGFSDIKDHATEFHGIVGGGVNIKDHLYGSYNFLIPAYGRNVHSLNSMYSFTPEAKVSPIAKFKYERDSVLGNRYTVSGGFSFNY